jgi:plasmid maintenance system antidote protein VapI
MNKKVDPTPITDLLRKTIRDAIEAERETYLGLERQTGVIRASIMRFVKGTRTIRLDMADKLAEHFGLSLRPVRKGK